MLWTNIIYSDFLQLIKIFFTSKKTAKSYTVQKGDTLWNICKKELGDGAKYQEIAQKNSITTPNNIQVGQVIQLE